jgi:hypothetical protein
MVFVMSCIKDPYFNFVVATIGNSCYHTTTAHHTWSTHWWWNVHVHIYAYVTCLKFIFMVLWLILFSEFFSHRIDLQEGRRIIYPSLHLFYIVEMISIVCEFVNKDSLFTNGDYDSLRANPLGTSKTGFGQVKIMKKFVWIIRTFF